MTFYLSFPHPAHWIERALLAYAPLHLPACSAATAVEIVKLFLDHVGDVGHQALAAMALVMLGAGWGF